MRLFVLVAVGALLFVSGRVLWRQALADRAMARGDLAQALREDPAQPQALLRQAETQLRTGHGDDAARTARRLLAVEPLEGRAYRVLAEIAERQGDIAKATRLYAIAIRRAPRDIRARAWWIDHELRRRDYPAAISQIDALVTMWPERTVDVLPMVAKLVVDPGFATALAQRLEQRPAWRPSMLAALMDKAPREGANRVMGRLHAAGALDRDEEGRWQDWMLRSGDWGAAYAYWASDRLRQAGPRATLPLLDNGGFDRAVTGSGFDWHLADVPGALLDFAADGGASGRVAHLQFSGRQVAELPLAHPMLLAPGRYRLSFRAKGQGLRAELGLEWMVACVPGGVVVVPELPRIQDALRGWHPFAGTFDVPASGCAGQWLRLRNAADGPASQLWGELWLDDVVVSR